MRKKKRIILMCLALVLGAYILPSLYVSAKVYSIARSSYLNYGRDNPYTEVVSDEIYERICYRSDRATTEKEFMLFPITYFWGGKAQTTYWYSYGAFDESGGIYGSRNVPIHITLELNRGSWVITNSYEHP